MSVALGGGAAFGLGVLLVTRGLIPAREPLPAVLARLAGTGRRTSSVDDTDVLSQRVGAPLVGMAGALGLSLTSLRRDLAVVGRTVESHFATKVGAALFLALLPAGMATLIALGGVRFPLIATAWLAAVLGVVGFFVPDVLAHAEAEERRRDLRHALGSFLDLVVIVLAAGGGVQSALATAAATGDGWAFAQLRRALDEARITRQAPWAALGGLGDELGVSELCELAASVSLAGTEGARVRESLTAKAASLRAHQLAQLEAEAGMATERMSFPVALLAFGFFALIGYPAVISVLHGI